ncbi:MAG: IS630 family transposase [Gemmatimonadales bacterium]|nr:MAG: IS630 family transposase [Gemmatimonadales bacterium]
MQTSLVNAGDAVEDPFARIDVAAFRREYKTESNPRRKIRLLGLLHLKSGASFEAVANMVQSCTQTVRNWAKRFLEHGLNGLNDLPGRGSKPRLPPERIEEFARKAISLQKQRKGGRVKGRDIKKMLEIEFGVTYSLRGVYELLDRANVAWITGRSQHPKGNPAKQEEFKASFGERVKKAIPENVPIENVDIWFQDEARVGQQGTTTRIWAMRGTRPRIVKQGQFLSAYIYGAVCPSQDTGAALVLPECNTYGMEAHLDEISLHVPEGRHAVVVLDGAAWHTTEALKVPPNISLLSLPPYSPELNPAEQVWEELRSDSLANRCYAGYEEIVDACCDAWRSFISKIGAVRSLCSREWAMVPN